MVADFHKDRFDLAFYFWSYKFQSVSGIRSLESKLCVTLRPTT